MGNIESQNGDHAYYGTEQGHLSRKHMSRSLRLSNKQSRNSRPASSSTKAEHRNSEASTRSSSTPSIPQSLAENGLEPFNETDALGEPMWGDHMALNLRPMSFHDHQGDTPMTPASEDSVEVDTVVQEEEVTYLQRMNDGPREGGSFKKKRSKSADMWREDSLEFSMSDLSQELLTSTEEIIDGIDDEDTDYPNCGAGEKQGRDAGARANSMDELCTQKTPVLRGQRNRYKYSREGDRTPGMETPDQMLSPTEDDGNGYGAYTLPCRRSHCLSEGLPSHQAPISRMQGRRAQTTHNIAAQDGSEYGDSGIDGVATEMGLLSRRCKTMSASFSVYSAASSSMFAGSDSGSSSGGGGGGGSGRSHGADTLLGVYENFRQELDMSSRQTRDALEEGGSAGSDERSSGTLSSIYQSDAALLSAAQGTVRKAGALAVKNFLVHKKNKKVETAARRKWKRYWVSLKGCTLFFYETDGRSGIDHNSIPKHAVWVENSIVQAVPEHPKKDFVFCLSNALGDAFLFQTSGQTELENWITAIHSACAGAVARQHHREDTVRLLRGEIKKLEQKIDMDEKMKKMGDMQLSAVTDNKKRKTILEQIFLWEQNLERFHVDLFRFRCYLASLQGGELPNPKRLLAFASRPTKLAMGRLGIFSVSSFHALVAARTEGGVRRRSQALSRSSSKRKSRFSSLWGLDTTSKKKTKGRPSINQVFVDGATPVRKNLGRMFEDTVKESLKEQEGVEKSPHPTDSEVWVPGYLTPSWVSLPNEKPVLAIIEPGHTALYTLESVCKTNKLDPSKHYIRLKFTINGQTQFYIPKPEEDVCDMLFKEIEIWPKVTKVIQFDRAESCVIGYGFSVVVVDEDGTQQLHVTDVKAGGLAAAKAGLRAGDEILHLNGKAAAALELSDMQAAFALPSLTLSVSTLPAVDPRHLCTQPPRRAEHDDTLCTDIFSQDQEEILDEGTILAPESPDDGLGDGSILTSDSPGDSLEDELDADTSPKSTEQVTAFCRSLHDMNPAECPASSSSSSSSSCAPSPVSPMPTPTPAAMRQLTDAVKLRHVICELVETERTYVKDLKWLMEKYLTPLQNESFLTQDELDVLFGNVVEMLEFQVEFLKTLEDGTRLVPDLEKLEKVDHFKKVLFSLGGSFLYYADRFKIYSAFCASHTKVPKVIAKAKTDPVFKAFLDERNPRQQHSFTLESYLIKPIQRVLKYPLLLRELHSLTDPESDEHYHLDVAMKAMNKVASHINEMQKIHEEYGAVFDQLINEQSGEKKEVADLSMGDLLLHATVAWINPPPSLTKGKKEPGLAVFVFRTALVFVYKDSSKHKKKMGASHRVSTTDEKDPIRFRHMIPTDDLQLRNHSNSDATAVCEIVHVRSESEGRPERTFHLCCSSPDSKKDFLKTMHSNLRRQLLKTESVPVNQQYIPFGGKRLCALKGARPSLNRAVSAPTRTLGRRKIVRNRLTIDRDVIFDDDDDTNQSTDHDIDPTTPVPESSSQQEPAPLSHDAPLPPKDTERWVEQQFDLGRYNNQVKETDILSDDDDYCESVRGPSTEPSVECPVGALSLGPEGENGDPHKSKEDALSPVVPERSQGPLKLTPLRKQCAVEGVTEHDREVIWVRRDDFGSPNGDVF
ncbi:rho guanine nucleotide exchange factor TIAM1 isoform X1 [Clupea harengus]|uniref:Rho guanine nucleotide exchange factor TIAM1 isoform X1 n=1 Tax=Clupea harengus TaxID=7950 RepID=A0A6P8FGM6_CLUHA|nr:rho guanine nucleotide exchange factor TIAM1 isoform X1 [Clupea harengus]XP_031427574.1 rho guanine nucleotide exchange factor TIAM1 isoform X1 [Clupea harengus]